MPRKSISGLIWLSTSLIGKLSRAISPAAAFAFATKAHRVKSVDIFQGRDFTLTGDPDVLNKAIPIIKLLSQSNYHRILHGRLIICVKSKSKHLAFESTYPGRVILLGDYESPEKWLIYKLLIHRYIDRNPPALMEWKKKYHVIAPLIGRSAKYISKRISRGKA